MGVTTKKLKTAKQLERHLKGVANHYRIAILMLVADRPGITVDEITSAVGGNFKTISEHIRRLVIAGLVNKRHQGSSVCHTLSPYGHDFCAFLQTFSNS